jgi:hypothetical protein
MSAGSLFPIDVSHAQIAPINQDKFPRLAEGSKGLPVSVSWQAVFNASPVLPITAQINLLQAYLTGQFTNLQAIWIDNSSVPYPVIVTVLETGQSIKVGAFTQGVYPVFCQSVPVFIVQLLSAADPQDGQTQGQCTTNFIFLNTPQRWYNEQITNQTASVTIEVNNQTTSPFNFAGSVPQLPLNMYHFVNSAYLQAGVTTAFTSAGFSRIRLQQTGPSGTFNLCSWLAVFATGAVGMLINTAQNINSLQVDQSGTYQLAFAGTAAFPPSGGWTLTIEMAMQFQEIA